MDWFRWVITLILLLMLAGTAWFYYDAVVVRRVEDNRLVALQTVVTAIVSLVSTAMGFYFGTQTRDS